MAKALAQSTKPDLKFDFLSKLGIKEPLPGVLPTAGVAELMGTDRIARSASALVASQLGSLQPAAVWPTPLPVRPRRVAPTPVRVAAAIPTGWDEVDEWLYSLHPALPEKRAAMHEVNRPDGISAAANAGAEMLRILADRLVHGEAPGSQPSERSACSSHLCLLLHGHEISRGEAGASIRL